MLCSYLPWDYVCGSVPIIVLLGWESERVLCPRQRKGKVDESLSF